MTTQTPPTGREAAHGQPAQDPKFTGGTPTDDAPGAEARSFQTRTGEQEEPPDDTFDPDTVEASRTREQGAGVGARELQRQRDAGRPAANDDVSDEPDPDAAKS
jgi:hypothetical protein